LLELINSFDYYKHLSDISSPSIIPTHLVNKTTEGYNQCLLMNSNDQVYRWYFIQKDYMNGVGRYNYTHTKYITYIDDLCEYPEYSDRLGSLKMNEISKVNSKIDLIL
jgi:hypothetical protein